MYIDRFYRYCLRCEVYSLDKELLFLLLQITEIQFETKERKEELTNIKGLAHNESGNIC
jgi:hypothetical protein